jgi:hypothetical protein
MLDVPCRGVSSRIIGRMIHKVRGGGRKDSRILLENNLLGRITSVVGPKCIQFSSLYKGAASQNEATI